MQSPAASFLVAIQLSRILVVESFPPIAIKKLRTAPEHYVATHLTFISTVLVSSTDAFKPSSFSWALSNKTGGQECRTWFDKSV
jgi:hypothetical protein